jgi:hypothetical protein
MQTLSEKQTMKTPLITDEQTLNGATSRFGHAIPVYDDGYGPLFIHRNSIGISGIVRAQTWHDAYSICEDEFFPAGDDFNPEDFKTVYKSGRELWLHENGGKWEDWQALSEEQKDAIYRSPGKDVPFEGEFSEHPYWQEQYGFRGNSRKESDGTLSSIYAKDLNGDSLDLLTPELLAELEITLNISEA